MAVLFLERVSGVPAVDVPPSQRLRAGAEMKAQSRFKFRSEPKSKAVKKADYDTQNLEAARIIAADPERYGPGMMQWARLVLDRHRRTGK